MMDNNTAISFAPGKKKKAGTSAAEVAAFEILQDCFASDADREEFLQAVKLHGITFLFLSKSPAPQPFKIYPYMRIGQISFWSNMGNAETYDAGYSCHSDPEVSKFMRAPDRPTPIVQRKKDQPLP